MSFSLQLDKLPVAFRLQLDNIFATVNKVLFSYGENGANDGARTRDIQNHNQPSIACSPIGFPTFTTFFNHRKLRVTT